jgi:hypothetical protein
MEVIGTINSIILDHAVTCLTALPAVCSGASDARD